MVNSNQTPVIRPADSRDDPAAVGAVYLQSWQTAYRGLLPDAYLDGLSAEKWTSSLCRPERQTLVAEAEGRIVGVCSFGRDRRDSRLGEIVSLYLVPEWFGQGVGTRLLSQAVVALSAQGFATVRLWVLAGNERAVRFYDAFGFVRGAETLRDEIGGRKVRELEYRLNLSAAPLLENLRARREKESDPVFEIP